MGQTVLPSGAVWFLADAGSGFKASLGVGSVGKSERGKHHSHEQLLWREDDAEAQQINAILEKEGFFRTAPGLD